jgi:hypothetical protein
MATTQKVTMGGVHVHGPWASGSGVVTCELSVYTATGQARIAELDELSLARLGEEVAIAQRQLATRRRRREREHRQLHININQPSDCCLAVVAE